MRRASTRAPCPDRQTAGSSGLWQREMKCRAGAQLRFHPNPAAVTSYDFLANGKTDSRSRVLAAMQPLKDAEHLFSILRFNSDAIVRNGKTPLVAIAAGGGVDDRRPVRMPVLDGIHKEVLEKTRDLDRIAIHNRQRVVVNRSGAFLDTSLQIGNRFDKAGFGAERPELFDTAGIELRKIEEIANQILHSQSSLGYIFHE